MLLKSYYSDPPSGETFVEERAVRRVPHDFQTKRDDILKERIASFQELRGIPSDSAVSQLNLSFNKP